MRVEIQKATAKTLKVIAAKLKITVDLCKAIADSSTTAKKIHWGHKKSNPKHVKEFPRT